MSGAERRRCGRRAARAPSWRAAPAPRCGRPQAPRSPGGPSGTPLRRARHRGLGALVQEREVGERPHDREADEGEDDGGAEAHGRQPIRRRGARATGARGAAHCEAVVNAVRSLDQVQVDSVSDRTFLLHVGGKIEVRGQVPVKTRDDLSMAYTPGVARVCSAIHEDVSKAWTLTIKHNTVAVVSDGSAVLGLGNIGPGAAMPVMEGKAMLFK